MIRRRVLVRGRVQGVWFRQSCREEAQRVGVFGWVRNRADGRVEAAFEGDPVAVDGMVEWCRTGPPQAVVVDIEVIDEPPAGDTAFRIN
jgi:acylphosphatase